MLEECEQQTINLKERFKESNVNANVSTLYNPFNPSTKVPRFK